MNRRDKNHRPPIGEKAPRRIQMGPTTVLPDPNVAIRQEKLIQLLCSPRKKKKMRKRGIHLIKLLPAGRGFENDRHWDSMTQQLSWAEACSEPLSSMVSVSGKR